MSTIERLAEAIESLIDLKVEGEPTSNNWISSEDNNRALVQHREQVAQAKQQISAAIVTLINIGKEEA